MPKQYSGVVGDADWNAAIPIILDGEPVQFGDPTTGFGGTFGTFKPIIDRVAWLKQHSLRAGLLDSDNVWTGENEFGPATGKTVRFWVDAGLHGNSKFEIFSGSKIQVDGDAVLEVTGTLDHEGRINILNYGELHADGLVSIENGGHLNIQNGGALNMAASAFVTMHADMTVESDGSIAVKNGAVLQVQSGGTLDLQAGSIVNEAADKTYTGTINFNGLVDFNGAVTMDGGVKIDGGANIEQRTQTLNDANQTITVENNDILLVPAITNNRTYTLATPASSRHVSAVIVWFPRGTSLTNVYKGGAAIAASTAGKHVSITDADTSTMSVLWESDGMGSDGLYNSVAYSARVYWTGASWILIPMSTPAA